MTQPNQVEPYWTLVAVFDQLDDDMGLDFFIANLASFNDALVTSAVLQTLLDERYFPGYGMTKFWEEVHGGLLETVTLLRVSYNSPLEIAIVTEQIIGYGVRAFGYLREIWRLLKGGFDHDRSAREVQKAIEEQQLKMIQRIDGWDGMTEADRTRVEQSIRQQVGVLSEIKSLSLTVSSEIN